MTGQLETTSIDLRRFIIRARTIPPDLGNLTRLPVVAMRLQERIATDQGALYLLGLRRSEEPVPLAKTRSHAELMDRTYRHQRLIYDITRRYFLLGRDRLLGDLSPPQGGRILEIACGTGRNLARLRKLHPGCALFGIDISHEMLRSARAKLGSQARLVLADACDFDGDQLFGRGGFDCVVLSYSLSMIPDWHRALRLAAAQLAPGGRLHVVDFGDQIDLPLWFRRLLRAGLAQFHVAPRTDLQNRMQSLANEQGLTLRFQRLYLDYSQYGVLSRAPLDGTTRAAHTLQA